MRRWLRLGKRGSLYLRGIRIVDVGVVYIWHNIKPGWYLRMAVMASVMLMTFQVQSPKS